VLNLKKLFLFVILLSMGISMHPAWAELDEDAPGESVVRVSATMGYHTSFGSYGNTIDTRITYMPFITKLKYDAWTAKITVPYLQISGPDSVIGGGDDIISGQAASLVRKKHSGLGDIVVGITRRFLLGDPRTGLDITGKIKLPTADEDRNLGTGKFDYTLETGLSHIFENRIFVNGKAGRTFKGSTPSLNLHDVWRGSVGAGYSFVEGSSLGVNYEYHQSASDSGKPFSQATLYLGQPLSESWDAQLYVAKGFTDGAAEYGSGVMLSRKF